MIKILRSIGLLLVGLLFLLVLISFFLPSTYHVQRSTIIATQANIPFGLVSDFKTWNTWSPWHQLDTNMHKEYSNTTGEKGSWFSWSSTVPEAGTGKMTVTEVIPNKRIQLDLEVSGMGISNIVYTFEEIENGTNVTWTLDCKGEGMPWYLIIPSKYFNLMMDGMLGKQFEKGLVQLKELSEATPVADRVAGFEVEERNMQPMLLAGVRSVVSQSNLTGNTFAKWFAQISQTLSSQQIKPVGAPLTIYYSYEPKKVEVEAAIPVASSGNNQGEVKFHATTAFKALVVKYYGGYNNMEPIYIAAYDYIKQNGKTSTGPPMEIYVTDPGMEKDTSKWLTEIVFPLDSVVVI
jgi:effector-binding domain-containing protein